MYFFNLEKWKDVKKGEKKKRRAPFRVLSVRSEYREKDEPAKTLFFVQFATAITQEKREKMVEERKGEKEEEVRMRSHKAT